MIHTKPLKTITREREREIQKKTWIKLKRDVEQSSIHTNLLPNNLLKVSLLNPKNFPIKLFWRENKRYHENSPKNHLKHTIAGGYTGCAQARTLQYGRASGPHNRASFYPASLVLQVFLRPLFFLEFICNTFFSRKIRKFLLKIKQNVL